MHLLRLSIVSIELVLLAGCAQPAELQFQIPNSDRVAYQVDCSDYCAAEAQCMAWPDESACTARCKTLLARGAFQAQYVEAHQACVQALGPSCTQGDLDTCWSQALGQCQPAGGMETLLRNWCTRWLECNGSSPGPFVERCLTDFRETPDYPLFACFSAPALEQLELCLAQAECTRLLDYPLLTICADTYR